MGIRICSFVQMHFPDTGSKVPPTLKNQVGVISCMSKIRPCYWEFVQTYHGECSGRREGSVRDHFFGIHHMTQIYSMSLYGQFKVPSQVVWVFKKNIFWSFLGEKGPINGRTCRNMQTISEVVQTWDGCLMCLYQVAEKSWGHLSIVQKPTSWEDYDRLGQTSPVSM